MRKKIAAFVLIGFKSNYNQAAPEHLFKPRRNTCLDDACFRGMNCAWHDDHVFGRRPTPPCSYPPLCNQAVSRQPAMQAARSHPVLVVDIPPHNAPQTFDVEECILDLERVEGPFNEFDRFL